MEGEVVSSKHLDGSPPVENVQQLVSNDLKEIPLRYIRPEVELVQVSSDESLQVPVIDMSMLGQDDEMEKLHQACKEWGFFQLINHGISEAIEKMKVVTEEFFKLPLEEKMAYARQPASVEGYGQSSVASEDQKLDWADMLLLFALPASQRTLQLWPTTPSAFSSTLDKYSSEMQRVSMGLVKVMAKNLGVEPHDALTSLFEDCAQAIRMNYYPPCGETNKVIGLTPHSDACGLTLLVQVNEVEGLQIKKNGKWVPINLIPCAIIVNIGDMIEILSNGEYSSIEHRAVVNPEKERLSIAAFQSPSMKATIGPIPVFVEEKGAKYKTVSCEEYTRLYLSSRLDGKSILGQMRITQ